MTDEIHLQDAFQAQVEAATGRPVLRWTRAHDNLKRTPGVNEQVDHKQVLLGSDSTLGVVGLIEAMAAVNAEAFAALRARWAERTPGTEAPSLENLATAAAVKLADLYETGVPDEQKTRGYRLMLAFGSTEVWQQRSNVFGGDPRLLGPGDVPGWPRGLDPMPFRVVRAQERVPFLDLGLPDWVDPKNRGAAVQTAEDMRRAVPGNRYTWVREYVVSTPDGREERADFTLFVHGLPILWTEMKRPEAGLQEAGADFRNKPTYRGAPLRLLCDGTQAVLTAQDTGKLEKWFVPADPIGHGAGMPTADAQGVIAAPGIQGGQAYLLGQVLTYPERLEFLLRRASAFNQAGDFLVARPQQYQALARWARDLLWSACAGQPISDRLIRHTQRTGKTHTMIRAIHLALAARGAGSTQKGAAFDLALLMVGEITIINQIATAFTQENAGLLDTSVGVESIRSRQHLKRILAAQEANPGTKRVVLANIQKLEGGKDPMMETPKAAASTNPPAPPAAAAGGVCRADAGSRALVVLDESHLSQTGNLAEARRLALPGATHLLLTATPKTAMAAYYGITRADQTLDDFGYQQALAAGLVVPMQFKRVPTALSSDPKNIERLAHELDIAPDTLLSATQALDEGDTDANGGIEEGRNDPESQKHQNRKNRAVVRQVIRRLDRDMIQDRLDAIVDEVDCIKQSLRGGTDETTFAPRTLVFCRDRYQAKQVIRWIQDRQEEAYGNPAGAGAAGVASAGAAPGENRAAAARQAPHENASDTSAAYVPLPQRNVYRGLRFGLDISDFGHGTDTLDKYNPGAADHQAIKARFENDDDDTRIDVLLAVGKYTKGYDNDKLCMVALLKAVREPSLINQIYTRPATRRPGKPSGVCLDLAFGTGNVTSWTESLRLYDRDQAGLPLFDENGVRAFVTEVTQHIDRAARTIDPTWSAVDFSDAARLGPAVDILQAGGAPRMSAFALAAGHVGTAVRKLPNAAVLAPLRDILRGLKVVLGGVRVLLPDADTIGKTADSSGPDRHVLVLEPQEIAQKIDQALNNLKSDTLKHFLNVDVLTARIVEAPRDGGSHALADARTHQAIECALAAAKTILDVGALTEAPQEELSVSTDPTQRDLRLALEVALARLMETPGDGWSTAGKAHQQAEQRRRLAAVQDAVETLQQAGGPSDFGALLTDQIRREFDRRWNALGLDAQTDHRHLFDRLIRISGAGWAQEFRDWRARAAARTRGLDASTLVQQWLDGRQAYETSLIRWAVESVQSSDANRDGGDPTDGVGASWFEEFRQAFHGSNPRAPLLRAAMGRSEEAPALSGQPSLLAAAATEAGRRLALIEANAAWAEAFRESVCA